MDIKKTIKKVVKMMLAKRPVNMTANITALAPNELLAGRTALITGGASGIGFSIAQLFLQSGASVCITGRKKERLMLRKKELEDMDVAYKGKVHTVVLDNRDVSSFSSKIEEVVNALGRINILVNNAGVLGGDIVDCTEETYDAVMDTNLKGTWFLSQAIGRYMKENNIKGNILNVASSSSLRPASSAYTLSKWGVRGMTLGLAKAFVPYGIVVNGIAPGPTATPMLLKNNQTNIANVNNPAGRYALPEEIANMAVFLVSDMGRMIVGDIVYMTGGAGLITYDDIPYKF